MFLSKNTNNSSSSFNLLHLTRSSDELDPLNLPSFSIRAYACSYRTKNIKNNWPFSSKSLQLCLSHGLHDPLPSFQPFCYVISHCGTQIIPQINQKLAETQEGFENGFLLPIIGRSRSKIQVSISNKNPRKKCRDTLKPGACVNRGSKEDSCLAVSESMALRTCPICKTFSSASNTALNAHIDQCLSVELRQPFSKRNRLRIKPVKVKLMTDIYAAAKGCTLEDIDKRNGTKWATISSQVVTDKSEMSNKEKKQSLLSPRINEDALGIGPVYIDSRGQKLRSLSEFREKSSAQTREDEAVSEKRLRGKKYYEYQKLYSQSRRLKFHKSDVSKIPECQRGFNQEGPCPEQSNQPTVFNEQMSLTFLANVSDNEDEDTRKLESELTQECQLIDDDEEDDYDDNESFEETVNKGNDVLDNTRDTDAEFESMIYEKPSCNSAESGFGQGSSLMEVDPIPIPGPPGAFLLSPWDTITDENLMNSSVITSQIQSSQDQLDFTDKNSSESAVSKTRLSTYSNLNTMLSISDTFRDQDLDLVSKTLHYVPANPSNPVLRLMGKDLMIINQEESSRNLYIPW